MFWLSVGAGVIANFLFVALTVGLGLLVITLRRRALRRFWGISESKRIRIYISHLRVKGALDATGTPRAYEGSVVTQLESGMGALLKSLFVVTVPGNAAQPGWLKNLLFVKADVAVHPAPGDAQEIDSEGTVVALGGPGFNSVSKAIETACNSPVTFVKGNTEIQLPGKLPIANPAQAVVVRLWSGGRFWFYAAGLSEPGTAAAAYYLARSWKRLDWRYRRSPFYVALEISGNDFRNARVISEAEL